MPNWCFNEFHIEIEGGRSDALEIVKMLRDDSTEMGRERLAGAIQLSEGEFPFEPLEIVRAPAQMVDAEPEELANVWRNAAYPQHASTSATSLREQLLAKAIAKIQGRENTPNPNDVAQADFTALNLALFGHPSAASFYAAKMGGRAWEGYAKIEEDEDGRQRIVARISSAWDSCSPLASTLLQLSEKIREVRVFWIEEGNDFYGGTLADRHGEPVTIEANRCTSGYREACEALNLPEPEPEEGEESISIEYPVLFRWVGQRLDEQAKLRLKPAQPSP